MPAPPPTLAQPTNPPAVAAPETRTEQMGLFGDRWQRALGAQRALASFDLEGADAALREILDRYPSDAALRARAQRVRELAHLLGEARVTAGSEAHALARLQHEIPDFLSDHWHRRIAEALECGEGHGAVIGGGPAGYHWLRAGDPVRAEQSLRETLELKPEDSRARAYLGDALFLQGRRTPARIAYRDALASEPHAVDIANAADDVVRGLPALADNEYDLGGAPVEWAAAVGLVERVFVPPPQAEARSLSLDALLAVPEGIRFYRWLVAEKHSGCHDERIACRRAMKTLSPELFKEFLEQH